MVKKIFSNKILCMVFSAVVCIFWGSLYSFIKIGQNAFNIAATDIPSIILFAGLRFLVCGAFMVAALCIGEKKLILPEKSSLVPLLCATAFTIIIHYSLTYISLAVGQSSKAAILKQVGYLLLTCFAFLFRKEDKFTAKKLIGGILGFLGVIVVNFNGLDFSFKLGDALVLLASVASVAGTIISKNSYDKFSPVTFTAYSQLTGGVILVVAGFALGGRLAVTPAAIGILAYICTASIIAYVLWGFLSKFNDISKMSVLKFMEPLFAVIIAIFLFPETESFKTEYIIAFIIIAAAVAVINVKGKKVR